MKRKPKQKISHIEAHDECGNLVFFEMPFAAMYYDTGIVSVYEEERIQAKQEKLATEYYAKSEKRDSIFSDLPGKVRFVNKLRQKGWGVRYKAAQVASNQ